MKIVTIERKVFPSYCELSVTSIKEGFLKGIIILHRILRLFESTHKDGQIEKSEYKWAHNNVKTEVKHITEGDRIKQGLPDEFWFRGCADFKSSRVIRIIIYDSPPVPLLEPSTLNELINVSFVSFFVFYSLRWQVCSDLCFQAKKAAREVNERMFAHAFDQSLMSIYDEAPVIDNSKPEARKRKTKKKSKKDDLPSRSEFVGVNIEIPEVDQQSNHPAISITRFPVSQKSVKACLSMSLADLGETVSQARMSI